jgi:hypothetical protein
MSICEKHKFHDTYCDLSCPDCIKEKEKPMKTIRVKEHVKTIVMDGEVNVFFLRTPGGPMSCIKISAPTLKKMAEAVSLGGKESHHELT